MISPKLEVLQLFYELTTYSEKSHVRRRIFYIVLLVTGSSFLVLLLLHSLNNSERKFPICIEETISYKEDNYKTVSRKILNPVTLQNALYCNISRCKSVVCASIPAPLDSGEVASNFFEKTFKVQCLASMKIDYLTFQSCNFRNNTLGPDWLHPNLSINALIINDCQLKGIHDDAFSLHFYERLKCLSLTQNNISNLRKSIFRTLVNLESLIIHDNDIRYAESNLLENLARCLETLELDNSIKNSEVLRNITGQSSLPKIEILSIQGNSLPILSSDLFGGIPNVKSIYTDQSGIEEVMIDAFQPIAKSIEQLFMRSNRIKTLKSGVLQMILEKKSNFGLNIDGNPWHCDCSMEWMKDLMQKHPHILVNDPICHTPEKNAGVSFTKVNFCNDSGVISSTATPTTTTTTTTIGDDYTDPTFMEVNITCDTLLPWFNLKFSYKSSLSMEYQFTRHNFFAKEIENGSFLINVTNTNREFTLIWFPNQVSMLNSVNTRSNIKCIQSFRNSIILKRLKPATSYTICLLEAEEARPSPLNCLALMTSPEYQSRSWLLNGDKPLVISLITIILFFLSLTSAIVSYIVIRKNPTLLRGSKRVLIVRRRRTVNVVVLPEGVQINSRRNTEINDESNTLEDHEYITPLDPFQRMRKDSQISGASSQSSGASYISGIEPNLIQLATWRIHRLRSSNFQGVEETPPLPPNHPVDIPSLSYAVDIKENHSLEG